MDSLSRAELDHLSDSCHEIKINAGEIILKEQAPGRHVAFLRKGLTALICSSRESVSKALVDLQNSNVLKLENKNIKIISKKMLKKISVNG